jgi:hypothetical protein
MEWGQLEEYALPQEISRRVCNAIHERRETPALETGLDSFHGVGMINGTVCTAVMQTKLLSAFLIIHMTSRLHNPVPLGIRSTRLLTMSLVWTASHKTCLVWGI